MNMMYKRMSALELNRQTVFRPYDYLCCLIKSFLKGVLFSKVNLFKCLFGLIYVTSL